MNILFLQRSHSKKTKTNKKTQPFKYIFFFNIGWVFGGSFHFTLRQNTYFLASHSPFCPGCSFCTCMLWPKVFCLALPLIFGSTYCVVPWLWLKFLAVMSAHPMLLQSLLSKGFREEIFLPLKALSFYFEGKNKMPLLRKSIKSPYILPLKQQRWMCAGLF